jgi:WD40 repeat protein
MLDSVVRTLEKNSQITRIRKLVFCACHSRWSKDAQNMSGPELFSCLQNLVDRHPSIVEFRHELYQIAIRLNHSSEYYAVSNTICEEIETVYDQLEFEARSLSGKAPVSGSVNATKSTNQWIVRLQIQAVNHPAKVACEILLPGHSPIQTSLHLTEPWAVAYRAWQAQCQQQQASSKALDRLPRAWQASTSLMTMVQEWYLSSEWQSLRQQIHSFVPADAPLQIVLTSADLPQWQWQWSEEPLEAAAASSQQKKIATLVAAPVATPAQLPTMTGLKAVPPLEYHNLSLGQRLTGYYSEVRSLALNLDRGIVVSAHRDVNGQDNHIKVWQTDHGTQIHDLSGHNHLLQAVVLTADGLRAYSAGFDHQILGWDLATGQLLPFRVNTEVAVNSLALNLDGKQLISGHSDGQIKIWDSQSGQFLTSWYGHEGGVSSLALTDQLLVSACEDGTVILWNIRNGEQLQTFAGHGGKVTQVAINLQGKQVVTAGIDCTVRVWDAKTGEPQHLLVGHERSVNAVLISPDGRSIISGSDDKTVKIWRLADGQLINSLLGHETPIHALATSGKMLATGGFGEIRLWAVE